ncbi:hypothetical protein AGMMS49992_26770 [Clostridia bacterium]|nr:hypothetical protein AGMMS49992_26770 [Clostridia bacterium]
MPRTTHETIKLNYWVSWYHKPSFADFELHWPWWISGIRESDKAEIICAAIKAKNEFEVRKIIRLAYGKSVPVSQYRFVELRPAGWTPFNDRFQRADWMEWEE